MTSVTTFGRLTLASTLLAAPALAAAPTAQAAPQVSPAPRYCFAQATGRTADGEVNTAFYGDRQFDTFPMTGSRIPAGSRLIEPVVVASIPEESMTVTTLAVARNGDLQSVKHTTTAPAPGGPTEDESWRSSAPVKVGQGWSGVRDIALPADVTSPYFFALLGDRLNRYTVKPQSNGHLAVRSAPHAATSTFRSVRSITWTRETTASGVRADVLVGLDGGALVEYIVPRKVNPRVTKRVLVPTGWGGVAEITAGACMASNDEQARPTSSTPILARVRSDLRLYVDRNNRDATGRDIGNYGRLGAWPTS